MNIKIGQIVRDDYGREYIVTGIRGRWIDVVKATPGTELITWRTGGESDIVLYPVTKPKNVVDMRLTKQQLRDPQFS